MVYLSRMRLSIIWRGFPAPPIFSCLSLSRVPYYPRAWNRLHTHTDYTSNTKNHLFQCLYFFYKCWRAFPRATKTCFIGNGGYRKEILKAPTIIGWECFGVNDEAGLGFAIIYLEFESWREKILMAQEKKIRVWTTERYMVLQSRETSQTTGLCDWHPAWDETSY